MPNSAVRLVVRAPRFPATTVAEEADQWFETLVSKLPFVLGVVLIIGLTVIALTYEVAVTPLVLGPYL